MVDSDFLMVDFDGGSPHLGQHLFLKARDVFFLEKLIGSSVFSTFSLDKKKFRDKINFPREIFLDKFLLFPREVYLEKKFFSRETIWKKRKKTKFRREKVLEKLQLFYREFFLEKKIKISRENLISLVTEILLFHSRA